MALVPIIIANFFIPSEFKHEAALLRDGYVKDDIEVAFELEEKKIHLALFETEGLSRNFKVTVDVDIDPVVGQSEAFVVNVDFDPVFTGGLGPASPKFSVARAVISRLFARLAVAGVEISPDTPQLVGDDGNVGWSIFPEHTGEQAGLILLVSADSTEVPVVNKIIKFTVVSRVTNINKVYQNFMALLGLVAALTGVVVFVWQFFDRRKAKRLEELAIEEAKPKLILPD